MRSSLLFFLCACSGPSQEIGDAGPDAYGHKTFPEASAEAGPPPIDCDAGSTPSATYPAPHPKMPLATTHGGAVLASPRFVPIVFAAETRTNDIATFMKKIASSSYWNLAAQYGVGPATATDPIVVDETPPATITDAEIQAWLATKIESPDPSSIYVVYYPKTTTIEAWGPSCFAFGGYHSETKIAGVETIYAVIADCPFETFGPVTSHELFEASTDPYYYTNKAWDGVDDAFELATFNTELGDLCEGAGDVTPSDIGYPVQRMWSNAAASAGQDPCQPEGAPYFRTVTTQENISLAPGETTTVDLVAFSDQDTGGPWSIKVTSSYAQIEDKLGLQLCRTSVANGEHVPLVIARFAVEEPEHRLHRVEPR